MGQSDLDELGEKMRRLGSDLERAREECDVYDRAPGNFSLQDYEKGEILLVEQVMQNFFSRPAGMHRHQFAERLRDAIKELMSCHGGLDALRK